MGFDECLAIVLKHEGSTFENDPNDQPTKFGIIADDITLYRNIPNEPATEEDIRDLTLTEARMIYKKLYWDAMRLDEVTHPLIQELLFDEGVLSGVGTAIMFMQQVLSLTDDGVMGPQTLLAINAINDDETIRKRFVVEMQLHYCDICMSNPKKLKYLKGWISRTEDLLMLPASAAVH